MSDETTECECEFVDHGDLGRVADQEDLARVTKSPRHYNSEKKQFKLGAFSPTEIRCTGISLLRSQKMSPQELHDMASAIATHDGVQKFAGVRLAKTVQVRNLRCSAGRRFLCIKDDPIEAQPPLPAMPTHALITNARPLTEDEALEIQLELRDLFSQLLTPESIVASKS